MHVVCVEFESMESSGNMQLYTLGTRIGWVEACGVGNKVFKLDMVTLLNPHNPSKDIFVLASISI